MKKILMICFLAVMLASCTVRLAPSYSVDSISYQTLTDKGIFATESNSVSFDYEPVASVQVDAWGGWASKSGKPIKEDPKDDFYLMGSSKKVYVLPSYEECFLMLSYKLKEIGANGIINLKFRWSLEPRLGSPTQTHRLIVSGMAIKK
jgi:hypothetical protein